MIKLHSDPHPAATKKKAPSSSTSAVAKLLLRWRGRSKAAKDESIEFFSELRSSQPDRGAASDHAGGGGAPDGKGKATRAAAAGDGGGGGGGKLLSTGTEKHDYDWLLTPPASPLWSPATSAAAGHRVSAAPPPPSRLERACSTPYEKGNSRGLPLTRRENGTPASRLARSSSATLQLSTVAHAPGTVFSGRRTLSSASVSSINTLSNTSVSSTPRGSSAATSPRTPATARSVPAMAAAARTRHRDRTQALHVFGSVAVAGQPNASSLASRSRPSPTAPSSGARQRAMPGTTGTSSPRSTIPASQEPVATRRGANSLARSGSTARAASPSPRPRDVNLAAGASRVAPPPTSSSKLRQVRALGKQLNGNENGMAAASSTAQRWRPAPPAAAAAIAGRNARREDPIAHGSSRNSDSRRKSDVANTSTTARRTADLSSPSGANGGSPTSAGGRNKSTETDAKRSLWQGAAAQHLLAAARRDTTPTSRRSGRSSVASRSRLGITSAASSGESLTTPTGRRSTPAKGRPAAAAAAEAAASPRVAAADAFPSTRYDAMLLREDPRNLTWLHGCDDDDEEEEIGGGGLVEASLESFDVPAGSSSTGLHGGETLNFGANL
uniref:Uncharacterized protein n=1 Tax=Oryza punctata TaxID=4537 RepID=A0A0E0L0Y1_ORYPU